jgi:hypothetical protein
MRDASRLSKQRGWRRSLGRAKTASSAPRTVPRSPTPSRPRRNAAHPSMIIAVPSGRVAPDRGSSCADTPRLPVGERRASRSPAWQRAALARDAFSRANRVTGRARGGRVTRTASEGRRPRDRRNAGALRSVLVPEGAPRRRSAVRFAGRQDSRSTSHRRASFSGDSFGARAAFAVHRRQAARVVGERPGRGWHDCAHQHREGRRRGSSPHNRACFGRPLLCDGAGAQAAGYDALHRRGNVDRVTERRRR